MKEDNLNLVLERLEKFFSFQEDLNVRNSVKRTILETLSCVGNMGRLQFTKHVNSTISMLEMEIKHLLDKRTDLSQIASCILPLYEITENQLSALKSLLDKLVPEQPSLARALLNASGIKTQKEEYGNFEDLSIKGSWKSEDIFKAVKEYFKEFNLKVKDEGRNCYIGTPPNSSHIKKMVWMTGNVISVRSYR